MGDKQWDFDIFKIKTSMSSLVYLHQHLGHVWLITRLCSGSGTGSFHCLSHFVWHWGQLWTLAFTGALKKRCVQGSVCMSTAGSLRRARGCFTGRVTEHWNRLPGEVVESLSHTCFPWQSRQSSPWRDWEELSFTGKGLSTIKRHSKKPHVL